MPPRKKYVLNPITEVTQQRLLEVEFYLFIKTFLFDRENKINHLEELLQNFCTFYNIDYYVIEHLINQFRRMQMKPLPTELAILYAVNDYRIRLMPKIDGFSNYTYYSVLPAYIEAGEYQLVPAFKELHHEVIQDFLEKYYSIFGRNKEMIR